MLPMESSNIVISIAQWRWNWVLCIYLFIENEKMKMMKEQVKQQQQHQQQEKKINLVTFYHWLACSLAWLVWHFQRFYRHHLVDDDKHWKEAILRRSYPKFFQLNPSRCIKYWANNAKYNGKKSIILSALCVVVVVVYQQPSTIDAASHRTQHC